MAIKERKQITGTTAQISAYEGHEGQIVWDKEKKTFVGMSGTAGKNYPLASQAYVDTQFLPLTGGLLSGKIDLNPNVGGGNIDIGFNFDEKLGGGAGFRSIYHEKEPGAFAFYAQDLTQNQVLNGRPDGTLTWSGRPVITQDHHSNRSVGNSWQHVFRFSNGLQIIYGVYGGVPEAPKGATVTYDSPFAKAPSVQATIWGPDHLGTNPIGSTYVSNPSETNFKLWSTWNNWIYWCAFGKWK